MHIKKSVNWSSNFKFLIVVCWLIRLIKLNAKRNEMSFFTVHFFIFKWTVFFLCKLPSCRNFFLCCSLVKCFLNLFTRQQFTQFSGQLTITSKYAIIIKKLKFNSIEILSVIVVVVVVLWAQSFFFARLCLFFVCVYVIRVVFCV